MDATSTHSVRLVIESSEKGLNVVSAKTIRMLAPSSDETYNQKNKSGFWVELRNGDGEVLYRKIIPNPLIYSIEAPSGDPERSFTRAPDKTDGKRDKNDKEEPRLLTLLLPLLDEAREIQFFSSPVKEPASAARKIGSLDFKKPLGWVRASGGEKDR